MPSRLLSLEQLQDRTSLLPGVIARCVIDRRGTKLHPDDLAWFVEHAESRTLDLYNVNRMWRLKLNSGDGRDFLYMFVGHWLDAFVLDIQRFKDRHGTVPEHIESPTTNVTELVA